MNSEFEKAAVEHGERLKVIPMTRLSELQDIIEEFKGQEELNDFQKWIVNNMYKFGMPKADFQVNSIILIAVRHPFYAKVDFYKDGNKRTFLSLVHADYKKSEAYLKKLAKHYGYSIKKAMNLPLKRLGVHSGLAKYGRNNITYIDGLGSNFNYAAYFTDMVCENDTWGEVKNSEICQACNLCQKNCPTGAILEDRFLIDNQKCLAYFNEVPGEFPDWIPASVHHTLYDCLICQRVCPMNKDQLDDVMENISFTEEETNMLLAGTPVKTLPKDFRNKIFLLGMNSWYSAIPRNLKTLFEL